VIKVIYGFDGKKWGKLIGNRFQIMEWDCENKDDFIQAGEKLKDVYKRSNFTFACQQAAEQPKASTPESGKSKKGKPKRKNANCNRTILKRPKLKFCDPNDNQILPSKERSKDNGADIKEDGRNGDIDDDDSDDLYNPFSPIEHPPEEMEEGSVVWAKFKNEPFWPAIFYRMEKEHKIWVYFFDETWKIPNMKRIINPVNEVIPFCCGQDRKEIIMEEGTALDRRKCGKEQFLESLRAAEEYLTSKASGNIANFFTYESEDEISFHDVDEEESATPKRKKRQLKRKTKKDKTPTTFKDVIASQNKSSSSPRNRYKELIKAINKTRPTLKKILAEEIECERHQIFKNGTASQKNMLKHHSGYGPIKNDYVAEHLLERLNRWFLACDIQSHFNSVTYVSEVWLPEAIILGLMGTRNISREDAEKVFLDAADED